MNIPSVKKRALGYIRISDRKQIEGESSESQKAIIQQYADSNGIEVTEWFEDIAKSGKNTDRPALKELLRYAEKHKGEIDFVLIYKMNRASRDLISFIMNVAAPLKGYGISLRSVTEATDDTKMGDFIRNLLVMVGQIDNENKSEVTTDNMKSLSRQGYWLHRPIIGYITH